MYKKIDELYEEINFGNTCYCLECQKKNNLNKPMGMWHCGKKAENGIMFVGKTAVTNTNENWEKLKSKKIFENTLYDNKKYAFWNYIKEISKTVYPNCDEHDKISITNLVKCNYGKNEDSSTKSMINNCIENQYLIEEIKLIKPDFIVFMLNNDYKDYVKEMFKNNGLKSISDEYRNDMRMPIFKFTINIDKKINCILVGHPQGKNKNEYIKIVTEFIKNK